jgi:hypothetical protein
MPSMSTNGSPSMIIRSENVPESPSSALQTTYFCVPGAPSTVFHLMPAGNAAPPRPRSPEAVTLSTIRAGSMASAALETPVAVVGEIILERPRIGDPDPSEGQPLLALEVRDLLGGTVRERVPLGASPQAE